MKNKDAMYMQQLFRETEQLHGRLRTGQRLLKDAIQAQSIVQATKLIDHFSILNQELIHKMEELLLVYQFEVMGVKGHVLRNGRYVPYEELKTETEALELDPQLLLVLEKVQRIFGEIPHDLLHIEDESKNA